MFLSRTLEAIDTPKEQAHKGSVEKIVNLKGLLKSPWTLMDDVWEEGIFPSSESSWISTNIFFKGPSIFQRKVYWLIMRIVIFCPPPRHHVIICHLLAYPLPPPRVMTSFMNSPLLSHRPNLSSLSLFRSRPCTNLYRGMTVGWVWGLDSACWSRRFPSPPPPFDSSVTTTVFL